MSNVTYYTAFRNRMVISLRQRSKCRFWQFYMDNGKVRMARDPFTGVPSNYTPISREQAAAFEPALVKFMEATR